ncbi:MAG: hypothetical protein JNM10_12195 [Planctomycetia bacterium]|nr:hypothetical protein [Planctomycetia bacterium]
MRRALLVALLPLLVLPIGLAPSPAVAEDRPEPKAIPGQGILNGTILRTDPFFRFFPKETARSGIVGTLEGTTREFESITVELGADRSVLTAAQRAAFEAYRFTHVVARGELAVSEVKPDGCVVRLKLKDAVYACATRQLGRTVVWVRGEGTKKDEAGLVKLVRAAVGWVSGGGDDVDGWIPAAVKATWTRTASPDLVVTDDGTLDAPARDAALRAVRDAHAFVRRVVAAGNVGPTPPVVRLTKNRDMMGFLSGRRDLRDKDAVHVPWAAELIVAPRKAEVDAAQVAEEAAAQVLQHLLGAANGEPVLAGLRRQAAAVATSGAAAVLLASDEGAAFDRIRKKEATTWSRLMRMSRLSSYLAEDAELRTLDAELAVGYLASGAPAAKASFAAWVAAFRKVGDPDAASEAAYAALDASKSDAEYWAFWAAKADPPKPKNAKGK